MKSIACEKIDGWKQLHISKVRSTWLSTSVFCYIKVKYSKSTWLHRIVPSYIRWAASLFLLFQEHYIACLGAATTATAASVYCFAHKCHTNGSRFFNICNSKFQPNKKNMNDDESVNDHILVWNVRRLWFQVFRLFSFSFFYFVFIHVYTVSVKY